MRLLVIKTIATLLAGIAALCTVSAQEVAPECIFEHYTSLDGLPHNSISDIYKDREGFVWLCTWYGLSRFDGYSFRNYRTVPGDSAPLSHNRFHNVYEDIHGYMWVITYDDHLYRFDRRSETFEELPALLSGGADYKVGPVVCSSAGNTWIAVEGRGLVYTLPPVAGSPPAASSPAGAPHIGTNVTWIAEGAEGRIFVVSERGLALLSPDDEGGFAVVPLTSIAGDSHLCVAGDRLFYGVDGTVSVFSGRGERRGEVSLDGGARITCLEYSEAGETLYIGTRRHGVARYDVTGGRLHSDPSPPGRIRYLKADSHGTLWVATEKDGIVRYDPARRNYKRFTQPMNAVSYYVDTLPRVQEAGGRVWIKMNRVGFGYYDRAADEVRPFYNTAGERFTNGVPCFTISDDNVLWMSTNDRGLEKITIIDPKADIFDPTTGSGERSGHEIRSLAVDRQGRLWMGNKNGELFCYASDGETLVKKWPDARSGPIGMPYALKEDREGNIWVGTKGDGVVKLTPRGRDWTLKRFRHDAGDAHSLSHDDIYAIEQDGGGRMWFGSFGGAINMLPTADADRFINATTSFPYYPSPLGQRVRWLHLMPDGEMAVGTVEGLLLFDPSYNPDDVRFRVVQKSPGDRSSLGNNDVIHMMTDSEGRVWISTFGGGLNLLEGYGEGDGLRFRIYSENEGLASNIVLAATEGPDGDIWVSTERGVSRLDVAKNTIANYSRWDGIPSSTFSEATAATTPSGDVLLGSTTNIVVIHPETLSSTIEPSALTFTGVQVDNRDVAAGAELTLPHDYSVFRIEFAALNHRLRPRISYMYRLEGFEREWTRVKDIHSAVYTNVPRGDYRFVVRSVTDSGADTGDRVEMAIGVLTPPWLSWWATMLYIVVGMSVLVVIYRAMHTRRKLRSEVQVERRMTDLKLRFFTNISHELRTPLTLILGSVEEVGRREALSPRGESNVSMAQKNAKRMLMLINQLLDFRKIVNEKMDIKVRRADIIALTRGVVEDFREMAGSRRIELMMSTSSETLDVWIDPQRMEGVVYNLLSNAFKYTPDGGRITVAVAHREGEAEYTLSVSDSGAGIPPGKQEVIFDRFVQVGTPQQGQVHGTGIGLALCKEIAELHHGGISVESTQGEGATFVLCLPVGNARFNMDQIEFEGASSPPAGKSRTARPGSAIESQRMVRKAPPGAPKLLLVEDNHELRVFIYNNLIDSYNVMEAGDGVEALEIIRNSPPDIVVTDIMMPRMDGIELTNAIREDFETSHIPVVMLTARTETDTRTEAMRYGADGYITKPFSMELLQARIENLLRLRRSLLDKYSSRGAHSSRGFALPSSEVVVTDRDEKFLRDIMEWIEAHLDDTELTIEDLANHLVIGRTTMYNKIKGLTGKSPVEIIKEYRVSRAMSLLRTGQFTVSETAYKVGFSDPGYFSKCFKEQYKLSPAEFLKNQKK